jgi:hypothetical protein
MSDKKRFMTKEETKRLQDDWQSYSTFSNFGAILPIAIIIVFAVVTTYIYPINIISISVFLLLLILSIIILHKSTKKK